MTLIFRRNRWKEKNILMVKLQLLGKKFLMHIADYARANNIKIIPLCPFAKSVFEKTESIEDVLA